MTNKELDALVNEIRRYKEMAEEATNIQKSLEQKVIAYMTDNDLTEAFTATSKITYKEQARTTLDKKKLEEYLGSLKDYEKVTSYSVLRIK
jgi:tyrosyl-tRNA synthetase